MLESRVKAPVKEDLEKLNPKDLFNTYGTHFLSKTIIGGRAVYSSSTNKYTFKSEYSLEVVASMSFKGLVGSISAEEEFKYGSSISQFYSLSQAVVSTKGGGTSFGGDNLPQHYDKWMASVVKTPVFVDFR